MSANGSCEAKCPQNEDLVGRLLVMAYTSIRNMQKICHRRLFRHFYRPLTLDGCSNVCLSEKAVVILQPIISFPFYLLKTACQVV